MTEYPELFEALARPFRDDQIKQLRKGSITLSYATARTYMDRLDEVLGPENWWSDYSSSEDGVMCMLTIRLPGGEIVTKRDVGGRAGMTDSGDDEKSGFSDAFKRACVMFGVGRFLYPEASRPLVFQRNLKPEFYVLPKQMGSKDAVEKVTTCLKNILQDHNPERIKEIVPKLYEAAVLHELAYDELDGIDPAKARSKLAVLYSADPGRFAAWAVKRIDELSIKE